MVQQIYGGLTLRLAHRRDLIALKLCAAADRGAGDPETFDKHLADLRVLAPTRGEIADGVRWARTQSGGEVFEAELAALVRRLEASEHG